MTVTLNISTTSRFLSLNHSRRRKDFNFFKKHNNLSVNNYAYLLSSESAFSCTMSSLLNTSLTKHACRKEECFIQNTEGLDIYISKVFFNNQTTFTLCSNINYVNTNDIPIILQLIARERHYFNELSIVYSKHLFFVIIIYVELNGVTFVNYSNVRNKTLHISASFHMRSRVLDLEKYVL